MSRITFEDLPLNTELKHAVLSACYTYPTEIQEKVIPPIIEGHDIIAAAPTGTGKTAAYLLPILQKIIEKGGKPKAKRAKALILAPTKELVMQTHNFFLEFTAGMTFSAATVFGGAGISPQLQALRKGVDILFATPGRLVELIEREAIVLEETEFFVIDEVDRMLQMGFISDIDQIIMNLSYDVQSMFFSATISTETAKLSGRVLQDPYTVDIKKDEDDLKLAETIKCHTLFCDKGRKRKLLTWLLNDIDYKKVLIFVSTKADADRLGRDLEKEEFSYTVIHGDKNNFDRERAVEQFARGKVKILVTTDLTARGFDIEDLTHVINFNLPDSTENFIHRGGRTGRAGNKGTVFSICDQIERIKLYHINRYLDKEPEVFLWHPYHSDKVMDMEEEEAKERSNKANKNRERRSDEDKPEKKKSSSSNTQKTLKDERRLTSIEKFNSNKKSQKSKPKKKTGKITKRSGLPNRNKTAKKKDERAGRRRR